jgi:hypothetical protein
MGERYIACNSKENFLKSSRTNSQKQIVIEITNRLASIPWNTLISVIRNTDSRLFGRIFRSFAIMATKVCRNGVMPSRLRKVLSLAQPINPLKEGSAPTIDIVIPCHKKDFDLLDLTIEAARKCVLNPIGKVKLITNNSSVIELNERFPDCQIISETDFLAADIMEKIKDSVPLERQGWVAQQILKFKASLEGGEQASLVLDADTVLIKPRVWLDCNGVQLLSISEEYHVPYADHYESVFGTVGFPWSFVTHHQLMQKKILLSMFGEGNEGLLNWLANADFQKNSSAISEYHTYGQWISSRRPESVCYAKWNNTAKKRSPSETTYSRFLLDNSKYLSVSRHSYI